MASFLQAFFFIFAAEMGDKTQLVALAYATRFSAAIVIAGVTIATLLVHLFSVALGEVVGVALPRFWVSLLAGAAFVGFGVWTLRGDEIDDEETERHSKFGPIMTVAITFFLAEIGDKTMLATVTLASSLHDAFPVWLGSTAGMVVADGLAVIVGVTMGKRIPEHIVKYVAAALFIASGVWLIAATLMGS